MVHFLSDLHLGHKKMVEARNFSCLDEMHTTIIENWNSVIGKTDKVYVLGDVAFGLKYLSILDALKGSKVLIGGNHDNNSTSSYLKYFNKIRGCVEIKKNDFCAIATHIPVHPNQFKRFSYNIHGHLHENLLEDTRYINVCCEQLSYTPISLEDIILKVRDV